MDVRKPVWVAMSDLFLDTDVRLWYSAIARVLTDSPFALDELDRMFYNEIAPILEPNLRVVAGEWGAFDEAWLMSRIAQRLDRNLAMRNFRSGAKGDWEAVRLLVEILRTLDPSERPRRIALWDQLSKAFLDRQPISPPEGCSDAELEAVWRNEMWPSYGRSVKVYKKHSKDLYPSEEEIEQAWTRLKKAVS